MSTTTATISLLQNKQDQQDEMDAVEGYLCDDPKCFSYSTDDDVIHGSVVVVIPNSDRPITITARTQSNNMYSTSVTCLPPVKVLFWLPSDYPSESSPVFQLLARWWTPHLERCVVERLNAVSEQFRGMSVIIACIEALKEQVIQCLVLCDFTINMDHAAASQDSTEKGSEEGAGQSMQLLLHVVAHDERVSAQQFQQESFECPVCLDTKIGTECARLTPCLHVFCRQCLSTFYEQQLTENAVRPLGCLVSECDSEPSPSLLRSLISAQKVERYELLLFNKSIERMTDTVWCPRPNCGAVVTLSPTEQQSSTPSKLATCAACDYSFCVHCGKAYHALEPCRKETADVKPSPSTASTTSALEEWECRQRKLWAFERASNAEKEKIYRSMGGKRVVEDRMQQLMNERWMLEQEGRNCPWCYTYIIREYGCPHMVCSACENHFCWTCGEQLVGNRSRRHLGKSGLHCRGLRNADQLDKPYLESDDEM